MKKLIRCNWCEDLVDKHSLDAEGYCSECQEHWSTVDKIELSIMTNKY